MNVVSDGDAASILCCNTVALTKHLLVYYVILNFVFEYVCVYVSVGCVHFNCLLFHVNQCLCLC